MSPRSRLLTSRAAGVALLIFALLSTIGSTLTGRELREASEHNIAINKCQIAFNATVLATLNDRSATRSQDADNLRLLVKELAVAKTHGESVAAMDAFVAESLQIKAERASLPLPPMEARRCE